MAKSSPATLALLTIAAVFMMTSLLPSSSAFTPFTRSPLLDLMIPTDDPFRILEQIPLPTPRSVDSTAPMALARADWRETPTAHHISLDVPGIPRDAIKIEIEENRVLRISGERKAAEAAEAEGEKWHRAERGGGRFWRQFRVPANADLDGIKARLENGVLEITVPKLAEEKRRPAKLIDISSSSSGAGEDL